MDKKKCSKCKQVKDITEFYLQSYIRKNKIKGDVLAKRHQSNCKQCMIKSTTYTRKEVKEGEYVRGVSGFEQIDGMIKFSQSKGYKSASYMIDEIGVKQFKTMYYDSRKES